MTEPENLLDTVTKLGADMEKLVAVVDAAREVYEIIMVREQCDEHEGCEALRRLGMALGELAK
jgi:hypothetical protein